MIKFVSLGLHPLFIYAQKKEAAWCRFQKHVRGTFLLWVGGGDAYKMRSGLQIFLVSSLTLPPASCVTNRLAFLTLRVFFYIVARLPPYRALTFKQ